MKKRTNLLRLCLPFVMASLIALAGCGSAPNAGQESQTGTAKESSSEEPQVGNEASQTGSEASQSGSEESQVGSEGEKLAYDEDGSPYVANQILLYAYPGTDPELIEKLAEEIDADIVEVTPEIQFYQLEFRQDKTYSELKEYIDFFLVRQFISDADLNYYSAETQPD